MYISLQSSSWIATLCSLQYLLVSIFKKYLNTIHACFARIFTRHPMYKPALLLLSYLVYLSLTSQCLSTWSYSILCSPEVLRAHFIGFCCRILLCYSCLIAHRCFDECSVPLGVSFHPRQQRNKLLLFWLIDFLLSQWMLSRASP